MQTVSSRDTVRKEMPRDGHIGFHNHAKFPRYRPVSDRGGWRLPDGQEERPRSDFPVCGRFYALRTDLWKTEGFSFFTLRPIASGGFFAMPGNRHNMPGRVGRNIAGHFDTTRPRPAAGEALRENLMAPQPDGVDAVGFRLGPNGASEGALSDAGGQYYLDISNKLSRTRTKACSPR